MTCTIGDICDDAATIIEAIPVDDAGLPDVEFRRLVQGDSLDSQPALYSAALSCRTFRVSPGEILGDGYSAGTVAETEQQIRVRVRYCDLWSSTNQDDPSDELERLIHDDAALIREALLRTPFGTTWTRDGLISVSPVGVAGLSSGRDAEIWIYEDRFLVEYERGE